MMLIIAAAILFGIGFNPFFWQSLRNSKYWDNVDRDIDADVEDEFNLEELH